MEAPTTTSAWSQLNESLRRFIGRRVSDSHVVEDLLQETFLRIHMKIGTLNESNRLEAWVFRIARNVILDHYRKSSRSPLVLEEVDAVDEVSSAPGRRPCLNEVWLHELIGQLPDGYRQAMQLSELDGLDQQSVADKLGLSLSAAKSRIQRGRAMLHEALDKCCAFEFDRRGNLLDVDPKPDRTVCRNCDQPGSCT